MFLYSFKKEKVTKVYIFLNYMLLYQCVDGGDSKPFIYCICIVCEGGGQCPAVDFYGLIDDDYDINVCFL